MIYRTATTIERLGDHRWSGTLAEDWDILGKVNGGYTMAIAAKASKAEVDGRDPVTVTAHFARPAYAGPVEIATEVVREGRRLAVVRARMFQSEDVVLETLGTYRVRPDEHPPPLLQDASPPDLPPPDECTRLLPAEDAPFPPPSVGRIDLRADPTIFDRWQSGAPTDPRVAGWFRLRDDEPVDAEALLIAADAFPPTAFLTGLPVGWTPTIELTVHIRKPEPVGWIRCDIASRFVSDGFIEEDGLFWDEDDHLVAQSRQLALVSNT